MRDHYKPVGCGVEGFKHGISHRSKYLLHPYSLHVLVFNCKSEYGSFDIHHNNDHLKYLISIYETSFVSTYNCNFHTYPI